MTQNLPQSLKVAAATELQLRRSSRKDLLRFTEYTTPNYDAGRVHHVIAGNLDRVAAGEIDRLMILVPPQHGKSQLASQRFPAFRLGLAPTRDFISASATSTLAEKFGQDVRDCIAGPAYRNLFDTTLQEDSKSRGQWRTSQGGSYYAVGIGGAVMGRGADDLMIDDPFSSMLEAQSQTIREKVWDWYTGTAYNRVRPGGSIVLICHRMHEDDLAGRLLAAQDSGDKWTVVELPVSGEPLWPQRFTPEFYARLKSVTPPLYWSALYEQNPQPAEGTFFQREWFWRFKPVDVPVVRKYLTSDFAVTEKQEADFTELGIHGASQVDGRIKLYLGIDGWFGQQDPSQWIEQYVNLVLRHRPIAEFGEGGVIQRAVEPFLNRRRLERKAHGRVEWLASILDKQARASSLRAMASMGLVGLPDNDYGERLLTQLLGFPAGKHDDAVDMLGMLPRALDMAHPAVGKAAAPAIKKDRYDRAFEKQESSEAWWA